MSRLREPQAVKGAPLLFRIESRNGFAPLVPIGPLEHIDLSDFAGCGLSALTVAALLRNDIRSKEELSKYSAKDLLGMKYVGRQAVTELRRAVEANGMALKSSTPCECAHCERKMAQVK